MSRITLSFVFVCIFSFSYSQEICDNGIDDDGDGLIDLNDTTDCSCSGILYSNGNIISSLIPNPSFEETDCCPSGYSMLNCATTWIQASAPTSDYFNNCDYIGYLDQAGLTPFPHGDGIVGAIYEQSSFANWQEYVGACLNNTMSAGENYNLNFYIASFPAEGPLTVCNNGDIYYGDVEVIVYGNPDCNELPFSNNQTCPPASEGWVVLGSVVYTPISQWGTISIDLNIPVDINAVCIGGPCTLPPEYDRTVSPYCLPYFVYDNLSLASEEGEVSVELVTSGNCSDNSYLIGTTQLQGGSWQWYVDGVAIVGETDSILDVASNGMGGGIYSAIYSSGIGCDGNSYSYFPSQIGVQSSEVFESNCGDFYWDVNGQTYTEAGSYSETLTNSQNCDSIVTLNLSMITNEATVFEQMCPGDSVIVYNEVYYQEGEYIQLISGTDGCDTVLTTTIDVVDFEIQDFMEDIPVECNGEEIMLVNGLPSYDVVWILPDGTQINEDSLSLIINDENTGEYGYFVIDGACISNTHFFEVYSIGVLDIEYLVIPNVITPNGDFTNDEFNIEGLNHACEFELLFMNRWGQLVYRQSNGDLPFRGKDETGKDLSPGVYFYQLQFRGKSTKGFVQVLR